MDTQTTSINLTNSDWDELLKTIPSSSGNLFPALTISTAGTGGPHIFTDSWAATLDVQGDIRIPSHGDIKLGDLSLKRLLEDLQSRLNILQPNPGLEQEWDELRTLGEQYRALEKEILDKQQVWRALTQRSDPENT